MKHIFGSLAILLCFATSSPAQSFLRKKTGPEPLTFKQLQLSFNTWKKTHDLTKEKHWKAFKRWEMETQMHTNAKGEPELVDEYIREVIEAAKQKEGYALQRANSASWFPVGPYNLPANQTGYMENGMGRINCMAFHPSNAATYFIGVAQGGLWKTTNSGASWTPLTDNLPITRISDVAIDPINPNTMYISVCDFEYLGFGLHLNGSKRNTHFGLGVYKTTDGGITWNPTGLSFVLTNGNASLIRKILVHPANPNNLVACGVSGMYTSSNGGTTWTQTLDSLFWDLVKDPVNPNVLYAATGWVKTANEGHAAIYKSTNFGATWAMLNTGIAFRDSVQRVKLAISQSDNNYIYAATVDTIGGLFGIYKSTNAGATWQKVFNNTVNLLESGQGTQPGGQGNYDLGFAVDPLNRDKLYIGGVNMWASLDGALTFNPVANWMTFNGPTIHGDIHFIETQPLTGTHFVCNDGGLYRTGNILPSNWNTPAWPTQWTNISNGLNVTSFYRISSSKRTNGHLLAGSQDNATFYYNGSAWKTVYGGDGMDNYLDTITPGNFIASSQYGNFGQTPNGGASFFPMTINVNNENGEWTTPLVADYRNYGVLYAGFSNVTKSINGGASWQAISNFPVFGFYENEISAIAVTKKDANTVYACKRVRYEYNLSGKVYRTFTGGASWVDVTAGLPDTLYFTSIDVSEFDKNIAYVTMAGLVAGCKVFKTINGGSSWQNVSFNLQNVPVNCIKFIPGTNDVMVATDIGIYTKPDNALSWTNQSQGLPNVILSDIEFNPALNKVYLATFGRGIWASDLNLLATAVKKNSPNMIASGFLLYPSVSKGNFKISNEQASAFTMEVIDVSGKSIYTESLNEKKEQVFNLALAPGMYYVKITTDNAMEVKHLVVE